MKNELWKTMNPPATLAVAATLGIALLSGCGVNEQQAAAGSAPGVKVAQTTPGTAAGENASPGESAPPEAPANAPAGSSPATRDAVVVQSAFARVSTAAQPAVVTITTEARMMSAPSRRGGPSPFGGPQPFNGPSPFNGPQRTDPFEEFFRRFRGFGAEPGRWDRYDDRTLARPVQEGAPRGGGLGSGLIYRADGYILTNAHVVADADSVAVKLSDGREFKNAKVVGSDPRTDVAVVKIAASGLPTVTLGDSSKVNVGDWAIAVGNPFGLEHTLTVGVISAKAREVPLTVSGPGDYLQTDASINPGNSGGPLLDIYGRVIGINNAIYSRSGGNVGIGFAIPINTAREIAQILEKNGRVRRAQLGVAITNIEDRASAFGLDPKTEGVLIDGVEPNSPASRAGLQPGDVIQAINGEKVGRSLELQRLVSRATIGSDARIQILRNGKTQTVTARLEELKDENATGPSAPGAPEQTGGGALGLRLAPLTADLARRFGISARQGVLIAGVGENSPAGDAGLRPGDVIERVGQTGVTTPQEIQSAVKGILNRQSGSDKRVALYINRGGQRSFVIVSPGG